MNRKAFEEAVIASELNTNARFVALRFAAHAAYKDTDPMVWPGKSCIAQETGMHRDTVDRYVEALIEDGWLVPAGMVRRSQRFLFAQGTVKDPRLQRPKRGPGVDVLTKQLPNDKATDLEVELPNDKATESAGGSPNGAVQLPNGAEPLPNDKALITIEQPKNNHIAVVASAPPFESSSEVAPKDDEPSLEVKGAVPAPNEEPVPPLPQDGVVPTPLYNIFGEELTEEQVIDKLKQTDCPKDALAYWHNRSNWRRLRTAEKVFESARYIGQEEW